MAALRITALPVGEFEACCFIVTADGRHAVVIDPGAEPASIAAKLHALGLAPAAYVLTHGHMDHASAVGPLCERSPAPLVGHPADLAWAFSPANQMPPFYPSPSRPSGVPLIEVNDGDRTSYAGLEFEVISTPGHTPGSICLYLREHGVLFTGDTLFAGSVGRTDLRGGDPRIQPRSLARLLRLPDDTIVHAGHGPETTLGEERRTNPYLRGL